MLMQQTDVEGVRPPVVSLRALRRLGLRGLGIRLDRTGDGAGGPALHELAVIGGLGLAVSAEQQA